MEENTCKTSVNKELMSKIYKECLQFNRNKNNPMFKQVKDQTDIHFTEAICKKMLHAINHQGQQIKTKEISFNTC